MKLSRGIREISKGRKGRKSFLFFMAAYFIFWIIFFWKKAGHGVWKQRAKGGMIHNTNGVYEMYVKRVLDFVLSVLAIVIFSPLIFVVAILVKVKLGSPIFFCQERPGRNKKIFRMIKFRTMTEERDEKGELLPDRDRLTGFGKLLRSTSLDELPELFNIARGDMSIVGPRPLLAEYLPLYSRKQARRHEVRPGLTGLAQISGRNGISWEEKLGLDVEYVDNVTFLGDLKIILDTVFVIWKRDGITSETSATMEKFKGSGGF